ncbi:MAG: serine/threonine protein kinase [Planctomycetaceae bacterium]|nr:serine/threonine protein kinase [Planctomycetaceae bacterium]
MANGPADRGDDSKVPPAERGSQDERAPALEVTREYSPGTTDREMHDRLLDSGSAADREQPMPRQLGKYTIQGRIGQGGMGVVWKGFDPDLHRTVAIKVLGAHLAHSPTARRRFQREARAAAAINHPNVLTIHAVEEQNDVPFLVMEYVAGDSLKAYVSSRGKVDPIEVMRMSMQISMGLAAAHAQGVIHRDVKPGNVMLHEGATRVRLADFGLARAAFDNSELTSHDNAVGTPAYMAPEQIRGERLDARGDLFSLGCVMYYMLVGYSPFQGRTQAETIHKILDSSPPRLSDLDPCIPPVLADIITRLLHKNPDGRYQSALEVADVLKKLLVQLNQAATDEIADVWAGKLDAKTPAASAQPTPVTGTSIRAPLLIGAAVLVVVALGTVAWKFGAADSQTKLPAGDPVVKGTTAGESNASKVATAPLAKLTKITVGSGAGADCATIAEAVSRAAENCTITVVGPGPFVESVKVHDLALRGLKLVAQPRAQWRPDGMGESNALSINGVAGVTVEGFDFEAQSDMSRGIFLTGTAENIAVVDCSFRHMLSSHKLSLMSIASHSDTPGARIQIQRCRFFAAQGSVMCLTVGGEHPVPRVECEDCQFSAPNTHFYATQACRQLLMARNVFLGGHNAINLSLKSWTSESRIEIVNNTFVGTRYWLGLMDSFRAGTAPSGPSDSRVCNNLILGGERTQGGPDQWDPTFASWRFASNWWERDATTKSTADREGRLATLQSTLDVPVRDDPAHVGFLVPAIGSPLLTSGCGGDLPTYIGAKRPADIR